MIKSLIITTKKHKEIIDITDVVKDELKNKKTAEGMCYVFVAHTTCALTTMDLDPGTDLDFLDAMENMFPKGKYRHPHDPEHVGDHIMSSLIGPSVTIPYQNGKLILGTWQKIVLVEFSGPRERKIIIEGR